LIEEDYIKTGESRGFDAGHEVVQVFADPFELKLYEDREDEGFRSRRTSAGHVRERLRRLETNAKGIEAGQGREGSDHRLGRNVSGTRNVEKAKTAEVSGRQK
jgi:hypothetical protein